MAAPTSVAERGRYVVTDQGHSDLELLELCACEYLLVIDGCYICSECGTIYGLVWGWNRLPRRNRWRSAPRGS